MVWMRKRRSGGWSFVEVIAVASVIAILLAMGVVLHRSMRLAARVSLAESNLKQVSTAMELYFQKYGSYPPAGANLAEVLAPFVDNPAAFDNPLLEEETRGQTISALYHAPSFATLDSADKYVTAMIADNGKTIVVLRTGNRVTRRDDIYFNPGAPDQVADILDPDHTDMDSTPPGDGGAGDGGDDPPPPGDDSDDGGFEIDDGDVTTKLCSDVTIKCVGSQFGYADGTLVDMVVDAKLGAGWIELYGGQPIHGGESFEQPSVAAGTNVIVRGEIAGSYERWLWSHYGYPLTYTSNENADQVLTLVKGDTPVCFEPGFPCQAAVGDLLEPYVDPQTHRVVIRENEALYLWDFNPVHTNYGLDYQDIIILATAVAIEESECQDADDTPPETQGEDPPVGLTVGGMININPNNKDDFEFELLTPDGPITRDDMHDSRATTAYSGPATQIRVRPKGNGNQNSLTVDGQGHALRNGTTYTISSQNMTVNLYNSRPGRMRNGHAMGRWWIEITATGATITP